MKNKYLKVAKISEVKFRTLVDCFSEDLAATQAARLSRVNRNTAQRIYSLLRDRIVSLAISENTPSSGKIKADENDFGVTRDSGKRGRGAGGKTPVIGLRKRDGKVFVEVVKDSSRRELLPVIKGEILEESTAYTVSWGAYDSIVRESHNHQRVHHHQDEFARGKNHVNGIESFWSYVNFRMNKLRGVKREKFIIHLLESTWRFNHKSKNIYLLLLKELRNNPL